MNFNQSILYLRQIDLVNQGLLDSVKVLLAGAGHINSAVGLILTKMGIQFLEIWDGDNISTHNLPNQFFRGHAGGNKARSLIDDLIRYASIKPFYKAKAGFLDEHSDIKGFDVVFLGVDNIKNRIDITNLAIKEKIPLLIDIGTSRTFAKIMVVDLMNKKQKEFYLDDLTTRQNLPDDDVPCTARATFYSAMFAASLACALFSERIQNKDVAFETWIDPRSSQIESFSHDLKRDNFKTKEIDLSKYQKYYDKKRIALIEGRLLSNDEDMNHMGDETLNDILSILNLLHTNTYKTYKLLNDQNRLIEPNIKTCKVCLCHYCKYRDDCGFCHTTRKLKDNRTTCLHKGGRVVACRSTPHRSYQEISDFIIKYLIYPKHFKAFLKVFNIKIVEEKKKEEN